MSLIDKDRRHRRMWKCEKRRFDLDLDRNSPKAICFSSFSIIDEDNRIETNEDDSLSLSLSSRLTRLFCWRSTMIGGRMAIVVVGLVDVDGMEKNPGR